MGGVNKMDWLINKYRVKIGAKKWYFPLFTNMIDMAIVNAHVLYCMANKKIPLLKFRQRIVLVYMKTSLVSDPENSGCSSITQQNYAIACSRRSAKEQVRICIGTHSRGKAKDKSKCAVCKNHVRKQCIKCNVGLHANCFLAWHQEMSDIQTHTKVVL